jgi:hypothetical protein
LICAGRRIESDRIDARTTRDAARRNVTSLPHTLAFADARVAGAPLMDDALSREEILDHDRSSPHRGRFDAPDLVAGLDNPL